MNVNSILKRVAVSACVAMSALVLASCSGTTPAVESSAAPDTPGEDAQVAALSEGSDENMGGTEELVSADSAFTVEMIMTADKSNPGVEMYQGQSYDRVVLTTGTDMTPAEVFRLENPARLVVDMKGGVPAGSEIVSTGNAATVKRVRFGSHQGNSRVVFDLNEDNGIVEHNAEETSGGLVVTLAQPGMMQMALAAPLVGTEMRAGISEEELNKIIAEQSDVAVTEISPIEKVSAPVPTAKALKPTLESVSIEALSGTANMMVADLKSAGTYTFGKSAPAEYILTLEQTVISPSLASSAELINIMAPAGAGKIRSVRAVSKGDDLQLRIFSEQGSLLKVKSQGNKLLVVAVEDELIDVDSVRAQAGDEEIIEEVEEISEDDVELDIDEEDYSDLFEGGARYTGRLISLDLADTEIDNALRIIAEVSNLNIIASDDVTGKVSLRLIDVPWDQALDVILKTNGLDKVQEGNVVRIAPVEKLRAEREALKLAVQAEEELEPLRVQYIRISYARASELQPLVETVITERGTVAYDERSNQLIVKDITKGLKNVARLVQKLDLRTPQVLIETQIVEASRGFSRELGSELGFFYIRSPETGNATPYNFPNSIGIGGTAIDTNSIDGGQVPPNFSLFPANNAASAVSMLFGSADGTKGLNIRLTQAEQEGRVRVVSRPSVAVTNNQPAVIKSVEKIRVKLPAGGVSVATGQGASAAGGASVATEVIEIGIILNVTAQASPDYYVLLDINAKSSTFGNPQFTVDDIPPEVERSATSTVLVSSGQTFAMGGIYRVTENSGIEGVPWVKDIPVFGHFFRKTTVNDQDEELIFFITPRIIEGSFDDAAMKTVS